MDRVTGLQPKLEEILGSRNVYFQPPETLKIKYPAIVYELSAIDTISANDKNYSKNRKYSVTLIDKNPDNKFIDAILDNFEYVSFNSHFTVDNLNHYIFSIFY